MYKENYNLYQNLKDVIVVGGGNTAIDAARVAKRKLNCKSVPHSKRQSQTVWNRDCLFRFTPRFASAFARRLTYFR